MKSKEPIEKRWRNLLIDESTSLPGYLNPRHRKAFVQYTAVLDYFGGEGRKASHDYKKFVAEAMEKDHPSPLEKGKGTGIIGKEDFVEEIKQGFGKDRQGKKTARKQPALRELDKIVPPDQLIEQYVQLVKLNRKTLTTKGKQSTKRAMLMELLHRFCKISQPEIGRLLGGIDYSAVSQSRKRLYNKIQNEPEWEKYFNQIQDQLSQMSRLKI